MPEYLSIDRQEDVISSLDAFIGSVEKLAESDLHWKYAIISIHNALQGCMCIALRNGNSFKTWKEHQFRKWYGAYNQSKEGIEFPDTPQLDFFMDLFDKCFSDTDDIDRDTIKRLNETRNNLMHFNTDSYGFHLGLLKQSCLEALAAIEKTPSLSQGIFFYEEEQEMLFEKRLEQAKKLLEIEVEKA